MIRKIVKMSAIVVVSAIILIILSYTVIGPAINNRKVKLDESKLLSIAIPSDIEIVESLSKVTYDYTNSKIVGVIAVLLRSDLALEEIRPYYSGYGVWAVPDPSENPYPSPSEIINFHSFYTLDMGNGYYIIYKNVDVVTQIDWRWE